MRSNVRPPALLPYIARLDTFRAIAALAVVVTHYFGPMFPDTLERFALGGAGVTFFFVLSGYLITAVLFADEGGNRWSRLKRFYIRRSFRIFPLYYFVLLAGFILGIRGFAEAWPWSWLYLMNFCPILCRDPGEIVYVSHLWTLAVEEQFYLLWPLLVLSLPKRWLPVAVVVTVFAIYAYTFASYQWFPSIAMPNRLRAWSLVSHAPALLIGALIAIAQHRGRIVQAERTLRWLLPITAPTMLLLSYDLADIVGGWHPFLNFPLRPLGQVLFMAWLIAKAVSDGPFASSWGGKVLPWIGGISYGIYVYHLPIRSVVDKLDPMLTSWMIRSGGVAVTILIAWLSYRLMEKPLREIGRGLAQRGSARDQAAS